MAVTQADLRTMARELAEKENDQHVTDAEVDRRVNFGYRRLWNLIRRLTRGEFFTATFDTQVTSGNTITMPGASPGVGGFGRVRAVYRRPSGTATADDLERLPRWVAEELPTGLRRYRVTGGNVIELFPASDALGFYRIRYESKYVPMTSAPAIPVVDMDARLEEWAEYPALYAARGMRGKEESEYKQLDEDFAALELEVMAIMADQDVTPDRIIDVYSEEFTMPRLPRP